MREATEIPKVSTFPNPKDQKRTRRARGHNMIINFREMSNHDEKTNYSEMTFLLIAGVGIGIPKSV